jgi:hypothetical protein
MVAAALTERASSKCRAVKLSFLKPRWQAIVNSLASRFYHFFAREKNFFQIHLQHGAQRR